MFVPRPKQKEVLSYQRGYMGVAAVPGSGKTATLSCLAAKLLSEMDLHDGQEILIVTLVNAAASNFARQVNDYVKDDGLLPGYGYRVRTLHSLANDILRHKPGAVNLDEQFIIVDERASNEILADAVDAWVRRNPEAPDDYLGPDFVEKGYYRTQKWSEILADTARSFIRGAKNELLRPEDVMTKLRELPVKLPLAETCAQIYQDYDKALAYRGAVDFQDLICLALQALQAEPAYLATLRRKWVVILEDEAQDSSKLQEDILRLLAGENGNWVRVGDPNQAIYESFTTADPKFLRQFIKAPHVAERELPNSGRSTASIQALANHLIDWSLRHPLEAIRSRAPLTKPYILPTPPGDPQPNPPDNPADVILPAERFSPTKEAMLVTESCKRWLADNPDKTAAILVARNGRGSEIVKFLRQKEVPYVENLNSSSTTRAVVGTLARALGYLADPKQAALLAEVYRVWRRDERDEQAAEIRTVADGLKRIRQVEDLVAPRLSDWLDDELAEEQYAELRHQLARFRDLVSSWLRAAEMPIDQLVLTISGELFHDVADIATAHMVALYLARLGDTHPLMRLPEFAAELYDIASNRRRFTGLGDDESQFDPDAYKGKVTVTTLHKAKGLEWDKVYLISINNYDFPSAEPNDSFIGEKWFIRDDLNLTAEALAQLEALCQGGAYHEGYASLAARTEYAAERLRLLYVGITRARQALTITWNTGRGDSTEALPLVALRSFWEEQRQKAQSHAT